MKDNSTSCVAIPSGREYCLNVAHSGDGSMPAAIAAELSGLDANVVHQFVFGGCRHYAEFRPSIDSTRRPTTWVHGDACRSGELLSMQVTALSGIEVRPVLLDGEITGYAYEDELACYCRLGGLLPADRAATREEQSRSVFDRMARLLESCGMTFTDTVRTWLYLDRLLDWYGPFNRVRTAFFEEQGVFKRMVPASTGIGAGNPSGTAIAAALIAVRPKSKAVTIQAVPSPLQCPALDYRSSFSRAVELAFPAQRVLYISGTASIDAQGKSVHVGDPVRQIEQTMRVVAAILTSRGMTWENATRGVAYYKDLRYQPLFRDYCAANRIPAFPLAVSHADVCRDDLLFELELDAAAPRH